MAGALLGGTVLALAALYLIPASGTGVTATAMIPDPLAARRQVLADSDPDQPLADAAPEEAPHHLIEPIAAVEGLAASALTDGPPGSEVAALETAVGERPHDAETLSKLGQVLVSLGRPSEAIAHFERAAALDPTRWSHRVNLARALGELQRWDESIAAYRQAQVLFPEHALTTFGLAEALSKAGDTAGAIEAYGKAIALNPVEASYRLALGMSHERLEQKGEAAAAYAEYLRLSPAAPDAEEIRARIAQLSDR